MGCINSPATHMRLGTDTQQRAHPLRANLTAQRWYPTALAMPNGDIWVPGGTWAQKPNGTWPKAANADMYSYYNDRVTQVGGAPVTWVTAPRRAWPGRCGATPPGADD